LFCARGHKLELEQERWPDAYAGAPCEERSAVT
jgi:hypothetical protein